MNAPDSRPHSTPQPLVDWFNRAGIEPPRDGMLDLQIEQEQSGATTKTLVAFSATEADVDRLAASGSCGERPPPTPDRLLDGPGPGRLRFPGEPDHPWWAPTECTRSFVLTDGEMDFVEVHVDDRDGRVFVRAIAG